MSTEYYQFLVGAFMLSIVHAAIPNHWIPYVLISKSESWNRNTSVKITAIGGLAHTLSTVIIGLLIGILGYELSSVFESISSIYAPVILLIFGIVYLIIGLKIILSHSSHHHHHHEHIEADKLKKISKKSFTAITISLSTAMFFSPCIEIEAFYFTAGTFGWTGIISLSFIYMFFTILGMIILVLLGRKSLSLMDNKLHFLEHYEKIFTGSILLILGILGFFIQF